MRSREKRRIYPFLEKRGGEGWSLSSFLSPTAICQKRGEEKEKLSKKGGRKEKRMLFVLLRSNCPRRINQSSFSSSSASSSFLPAAKPSGPRTAGVVVGGAVWRSSISRLNRKGPTMKKIYGGKIDTKRFLLLLLQSLQTTYNFCTKIVTNKVSK